MKLTLSAKEQFNVNLIAKDISQTDDIVRRIDDDENEKNEKNDETEKNEMNEKSSNKFFVGLTELSYI